MLSGKQCAQERRKQQYKLPQAAPPTRKRRDRSTLPLELMDLSNTLFHAFCFWFMNFDPGDKGPVSIDCGKCQTNRS